MKVFLTGASGYIGGNIAARLLQGGHHVIGLVRNSQRVAAVKALGVEVVVGELSDAALLASHAVASDAVVNAANADERPPVEAMLEALRGSGKVFVQTSGSGIVADDAGGNETAHIYEDDSPVTPLPVREARVALNEFVLDARQAGVRASVIAPPMVYGRGPGSEAQSLQIPAMIRLAKKSGGARVIGPGRNAWSNVHVIDLADLYAKVVESSLPGAFFYVESGENSLWEIALAIQRMLGAGELPASMTMQEAIEAYGEGQARFSLGSNSRVRAVRAREQLGWHPQGRALLEEIIDGCYAQTEGAMR